jgi:hypothetical protein
MNDDDQVEILLYLPRSLFNGLRELGNQYGKGVHAVIRHLAHNAVDNAAHKNKQND